MPGAKRRYTAGIYQRVFSTPDGQIVLTDLCAAAQLNSHLIGETTEETYAHLGARRLVLRIFDFLGVAEGEVVRELAALQGQQDKPGETYDA